MNCSWYQNLFGRWFWYVCRKLSYWLHQCEGSCGNWTTWGIRSDLLQITSKSLTLWLPLTSSGPYLLKQPTQLAVSGFVFCYYRSLLVNLLNFKYQSIFVFCRNLITILKNCHIFDYLGLIQNSKLACFLSIININCLFVLFPLFTHTYETRLNVSSIS